MCKVNLKIEFKSYEMWCKCNHVQNRHGKIGIQLDPHSRLGLMGKEGTKRSSSGNQEASILHEDAKAMLVRLRKKN